MTGTDEDSQPFDCPRCGAPVQERFWGPCRECRAQLVATLGHGADDPGGADSTGEATPSRFEPAMHVVPNHVATKD